MSTPYTKIRTYILWSVGAFVVLASSAIVAMSATPVSSRPWAAAFGAAYAGLTFTSTWLTVRMTLCAVEKRNIPRQLPIVHLASALTSVILSSLAFDPPAQRWAAEGATILAVGSMMLGLGPWLVSAGAAGLGGLCLVTVGAGVGVGLVEGRSLLECSAVVTLGLVLSVAYFLGLRTSVWMLNLSAEQVKIEQIRAELAVAEERLRFSRDLHDIFGRTLTAVAVKSDLAAELSEAGRLEQAANEMRAVHSLAEEALAEVRDVVVGYRAPSLSVELAGLGSLLEAASCQLRVIGSVKDVRTDLLEPFAWVVREAGTNILRHATPSQVIVRLSNNRIEIDNDGAKTGHLDQAARDTGSGLSGLRQRMMRIGGTLGTESKSDRFLLRAEGSV